MPRALVTGSDGFIGKNLVRSLEEDSFEIVKLDADYFKNQNWTSILSQQIEDSGANVIFHVGACSNTLETDVQYMMERNYQSTKLIADWCRRSNVPLVYSSSAANFGVNGLFPSNLYGWSKYVAEDYVIKSGGIALRYFNVFGPGEELKGNMASFLFQALISQMRNQPVKLFPGEPKRDFIYIKDVIAANIYAFKNYHRLEKIYYEVSTGEASSFEKVLGLAGIDYIYALESEVPEGYQYYTCGNSQRWIPGWRPKFSLELGVFDYLSQFRAQAIEIIG